MKIESMIYILRGKQVLIDKDLAVLYGVETRVLNQAVKRNKERFPEDFAFQVTRQEMIFYTENNVITKSRSQSVIMKEVKRRGENIKYLPYAFTESGVAMLSGVLKSPRAVEVNIQIMRAFVSMRRTIAENSLVFNRIESIENSQLVMQKHLDDQNQHLQKLDGQFEDIFRRLDNSGKAPEQGVFCNGQIFDAYAFICQLIKGAKERVILVDNYIDETVLMLLEKRDAGVQAKIYTGRLSAEMRLDLSKHNAQYSPIDIQIVKIVHDRFLVTDDRVYHVGASIKDLGKKLCAFSLIRSLGVDDLLRFIGV